MDSLIFLKLFSILMKLQVAMSQLDNLNNYYANGINEEVYSHNYGNFVYDRNHQPYLIFNNNYGGLDYGNPVASASEYKPTRPINNIDINRKETISSLLQRLKCHPNYNQEIRTESNNLLYCYPPHYISGVNVGMQQVNPYAPVKNGFDFIPLPQQLYWGAQANQFLPDNSGQFSIPNVNIQPPNDGLYQNINNISSSGNNKPEGGFNSNFNMNKCDIICKCRNIVKQSLTEDGIKTENQNVNGPRPTQKDVGTKSKVP